MSSDSDMDSPNFRKFYPKELQGSDFAVPSSETRFCTGAARKLKTALVKYQSRGQRFKMFNRTPIDTFDASDAQLVPSVGASAINPSETPSGLVLITLLELYCHKEEKDPRKANQVFEKVTKLLFANKMIPAWIMKSEGARTRADVIHYIKQVFLCQPKTLSYVTNNQQRYTADFKEICQLGQGGFGSVYELWIDAIFDEEAERLYKKALNNLDGRHYAIKKIPINNFPDSVTKVFIEVKTLASLDNPYIVRYHSAWIESCNTANGSPSSSNVISNYTSASKIKELTDSAGNSIVFAESSNNGSHVESSRIDFAKNSSNDNNNSSSTVLVENLSEVDFVPSNEVSTFVQNTSVESFDKCVAKISLTTNRSWSSSSAEENQHHSTLFIQMELCKETLKEWLETRNSLSESSKGIVNDIKNRTIFQGMLEGVLCIHAEEIIHRDLKPDNIFLKDITHAKIGDFGLATSRNQTEYRMNSPGSDRKHLTKGVGTLTYSAPEQQTGSNYDTKSDIYSLGLILYEMYHPCKTIMERVELFDVLRKTRKISNFVLENFPQKAEMIMVMTNPDPTKRPTAKELLAQEQPPSKDEIISDYKKEVAILKAEIERLNLKLDHKSNS